MRASAFVVGIGLVALVLAGCADMPDPDGRALSPSVEPTVEPAIKDAPTQPPPVELPVTEGNAAAVGIALPSLDGLDPTSVGPPDDGPAGAAKWLRKITVHVPAEGETRVIDVRDASQWRGIALPRIEGQHPIPKRVRPEALVKVAADGAIRAGGLAIGSARELRVTLRAILARNPDLRLVFDADPAALWGKVMKVAAVAIEVKSDLLFQAPSFVEGQAELRTLRERILLGLGGPAPETATVILAEADPRYETRAPNACVRIRADVGAPYSSVQQAMVAAMMNYVWRISFIGLIDGREVEIGIAYDRPDDPPSQPPVLDQRPPEFERAVIVTDDETGKFVLRTEDEVVESPIHAEDEISEIPLGSGIPDISPSIVATSGGAGCYGFRSGGGRRRAALRGGGSRRSGEVVAAAHAWLARNQEPDGRWSSAKHGGAEGLDVAVTGLATLSFLGAGQTEHHVCRHRETVRKAIAWLVANQTDDGCLADDAAKRAGRAGTNHAIAGLALAEALGMARVRRTGEAAQKAINYSIDIHQRKYSGWGEEPKGGPDTRVTGWFTAQLKSAKIAGLLVKGQGFQGSIAWLDKVTDFPGRGAGPLGGAARIRPGRKPSPTATAVAAFARQIMGWKRTEPILVGGADFVLAHLPEAGAKEFDHEFLYWGTLAMFQMGGDHWREWNARVRDMLIDGQQSGTGDTALDGSWEPTGATGRDFGRAGVTALASMCLEVYYRYLPLYR